MKAQNVQFLTTPVARVRLAIVISMCIDTTSIALPSINIPQPLFCHENCTCAKNEVDCSDGGFERLPSLFRPISRLDISDNSLGPVMEGSFERLKELRDVDLSKNNLQRLQLCTFTGLLHLTRVDLHGNRLTDFPSALFADSSEIKWLDLSYNNIAVLPNLMLHTMPKLKVLNISNNHATYLKLGLRFQNLRELVILDLSHNPFRNVSQDAFEMTQTWHSHVYRNIDLSYCGLTYLHPSALTAIPGLRNLSLSGNHVLSHENIVGIINALQINGLDSLNLSDMQISNPNIFSDVFLMALKILNLSQNNIHSFPNASFSNVQSLHWLDVSGNFMSSLDTSFQDLVNMKHLNISNCQLTSFSGKGASHLTSLNSLDVSRNRLRLATEVNLSSMKQLRLLDLSHNALLSVPVPGDTTHLQIFNLASNGISTLESMSNMNSLRYFYAQDNNLRTIRPHLFPGQTDILLANFSQNEMTSIDHRTFLPNSPETIDMSSNSLISTNFLSWTNTKEIYLQNNMLTHLDQQTFYGMEQVTKLDLSHNNLTDIDELTLRFLKNLITLKLSSNFLSVTSFYKLFEPLAKLQSLDLSQNKIAMLNETSLIPLVLLRKLSLRNNRLKVIPAEIFQSSDHLTDVDISGNPFDCGCELLPLQSWLTTVHAKMTDNAGFNTINPAMCFSPPEHKNQLVIEYTVSTFQCNTEILYILVFCSAATAAILLAITASVVYKVQNRKQSRHLNSATQKQQIGDQKGKKAAMRSGNNVDLVRVGKTDILGKQGLTEKKTHEEEKDQAGENGRKSAATKCQTQRLSRQPKNSETIQGDETNSAKNHKQILTGVSDYHISTLNEMKATQQRSSQQDAAHKDSAHEGCQQAGHVLIPKQPARLPSHDHCGNRPHAYKHRITRQRGDACRRTYSTWKSSNQQHHPMITGNKTYHTLPRRQPVKAPYGPDYVYLGGMQNIDGDQRQRQNYNSQYRSGHKNRSQPNQSYFCEENGHDCGITQGAGKQNRLRQNNYQHMSAPDRCCNGHRNASRPQRSVCHRCVEIEKNSGGYYHPEINKCKHRTDVKEISESTAIPCQLCDQRYKQIMTSNDMQCHEYVRPIHDTENERRHAPQCHHADTTKQRFSSYGTAQLKRINKNPYNRYTEPTYSNTVDYNHRQREAQLYWNNSDYNNTMMNLNYQENSLESRNAQHINSDWL